MVISTRRFRRSRRGFSLVEMLIALAISASLLAASLAALDAIFKSYKMTTDSASTHVVSRIVMHRVLTMIRGGREFGPYPVDVLDPGQNPIVSNFIEFVSFEDVAAGQRQITRIESRDVTYDDGTTSTELWYILMDFENGTLVSTEERPLIRELSSATFTLEYDVGPRLRRAMVDLVIKPNDDLADSALAVDFIPPTIRMVASARPRQLD